jgi:hypothetical protein
MASNSKVQRISYKVDGKRITRKQRGRKRFSRPKLYKDKTNTVQLANVFQFRWGGKVFGFRVFNSRILTLLRKADNGSKFVRSMLIEAGYDPETLAQEHNVSKAIMDLLVDKFKVGE